MKACDQRRDNISIEVRARVEFAQDLRAVEAVYHQNCAASFMSAKNIKHAGSAGCNLRNLDLDNQSAFEQLCIWLQEEGNIERQYTMAELRHELSQFLPDGVPAYSTKHLKLKLMEFFGDQLIVSEVEGKMNVLTFTRSATTILHQSYTDSTSDDEKLQAVIDIGLSIRQELRADQKKTDSFPSPNETNVDVLESLIPTKLLKLMTVIIHGRYGKCSESTRLIIVSVCHAILQATKQPSFISPLQLSTGLFIHQTTRSRLLIDVLSSMGMCLSYNHVLTFERSAAVSTSGDGLPPGLQKVNDGGGFCQWVADNFDFNEDTLTGLDTTHVMGMIACQIGQSSISG